MLEMRAIVIQIEGEHASVRPMETGGCGHCSTEGGCGSGKLTKLFCSSKPRHFKVLNQAGAKVGDEVQVSIPDGALLRGAAKMYVLPLILLLLGGVAGVFLSGTEGLAGRDALSAVGAGLGLLLGFALARYSSGYGLAVASSIISSRRFL